MEHKKNKNDSQGAAVISAGISQLSVGFTLLEGVFHQAPEMARTVSLARSLQVKYQFNRV
ncbi:hypothetical protein [Sandarakinorhabdus sp.]|uniref:hypothetical protein n=1 Tax=Sandarakinorhabdus sp. TaxID=1916663 RepID=UPI00286D9E54|nr:hypothetical protein [Sandarakinorhabdus sp.]